MGEQKEKLAESLMLEVQQKGQRYEMQRYEMQAISEENQTLALEVGKLKDELAETLSAFQAERQNNKESIEELQGELHILTNSLARKNTEELERACDQAQELEVDAKDTTEQW